MSNQEKSIILILNGDHLGPYTVDQVKEMLARKEISLDTLCWRKDAAKPSSLRSQKEFSQNPFETGDAFAGQLSTKLPVQTQDAHIRNIVVDILFTLITCGLYNMYIQYLQIQAINDMLQVERYNFLHWILFTFLTCGLYHIYHEYRKGQDIGNCTGSKDLHVVSLVLTILGLGIVSDAIQQSEINRYYGSSEL